MDKLKNWGLSIVGIALVGLLAYAVCIKSSNITVNVGGDTTTSPPAVVVSGDANDSETPAGTFGAAVDETSVWTSGRFTNNLTVLNNLTVNGRISSTSSNALLTRSFTSSGSSQTLCSIQNPTSRPVTVETTALQYATTTRTGGPNPRFTISVSSSATAATGTAPNLLLDQVFDFPTNGLTNVTPTSTLDTARVVLQSGYYLHFLIDSPTSTLSGVCQASFL